MYKSTDSAVSGRDYPFVFNRVPEQKPEEQHMPKVDSVRINRTKVSSPVNMAPHLGRYDTVGARNTNLATSLKDQISSVR